MTRTMCTILLLLGTLAYAYAGQAELQKIDLNGLWDDNGRLVRIRQTGSSILATHLVPRLCDHRDGTGNRSEYKYSFKGTLVGNKLKGTTCVCNYGKDNPRGVGIEEVDIELTLTDPKTLSGTYLNTHDNVRVPLSIVRVDCKAELEKAKKDVERLNEVRKSILAAEKQVGDELDRAFAEGNEAFETGIKRQLTDLSPVPLGLDTKEEPAEEGLGWVADAADFFEKKLPKPVAKAAKRFMWIKYTRDVSEQLGKQVTVLREVWANESEYFKILERSSEANLKWLEAVRRLEELKKECPEEARDLPAAAAPPSPEQAAKSLAEAEARRTQAQTSFTAAGKRFGEAARELQQTAAALDKGSGDTLTDAQVEALRRGMVRSLKLLREGIVAQRRGLAVWKSSRPVG